MTQFRRLVGCFAALFLLFWCQKLSGQAQLGMRMETFAGMYATAINPANSALMPHNWEISLLNADVFVENSYGFLRNTSLQNALRNTDRIVSVAEISPERPAPPDAILFDFFDRTRRMRGVGQGSAGGPGFAFRAGGQHVFGLSTAMRGHVSGYRIPAALRYAVMSKLKRGEVLDIQSFGVQGMAWGEIGLHYSQLRDGDGDRAFAWGISPKLLLGFEGGFGRSERGFQYTPGGGDTALLGSPSWRYGLSGGILDETRGPGAALGGLGFGMDIGFTWAMPGEEEGQYRWRAGLSLLDLGFVRFGDGAAQHRLQFDNTRTVDGAAITASDVRGYTQKISALLLGDPEASLQGNAFAVGLPTALSGQLDWQLRGPVFVSGVLVQRLALLPNSLRRPSTLALVPRVEQRWLSLSMPLVLSDWQSLRVGLAARLGWLYLGSDNLGSFFNKARLSGADAYIGLKINGFQIQTGGGDRLRRESGGRSARQRRNKIKCYEF
jgi:hypothetical protein